MTRIRSVFLGLSVLVLGLLAVSWYLYQSLPSLLREQVQGMLLQYGVHDIDFAPVQVALNTVRVNQIRLHGTYRNFEYEALLDSMDLRYDWRALVNGHALSLTLSGLRLVIEQKAAAGITEPVKITLDEMLSALRFEQIPVRHLQINDWHIDYRSAAIPALSASGPLVVAAALEDGQHEVTLQPTRINGNLRTGLLSLPKDSQRWLGWKETVPVRLEIAAPATITSGNDGNWALQLRDTLLTLGDKNSSLGLDGLSLDATATGSEPVQLKTQLNASVKTRLHKQSIPQLELAWRQQGKFEHSEFQLGLTDTAQNIRADVQGYINLVNGDGKYHLDAQSDDLPRFVNSVIPLLRHFELLQESVELVSGRVGLKTTLKSRDFAAVNWSQQSHLTLQEVSGSVGEYHFEGLALAANWSGITQWQTQQPAELSLAKLNLGFAVRDIQLQVSLPKATPVAMPQLRIDTFTAGMFGGKLHLTQPQAWDFAAPVNQLTLRAQQWQLAELVALQKNKDIQAQGTLEGELPVTFAAGRIIIKNGYLRALPPGGSIRYTANEASRAFAANSAELAMALDLLSDFQYQVLNSEVQLDAAGNLLLALSLTGSNPAHYEGQSINFNINLEQNLDPLLQSLRLSDTLVKQIEGGLQ